MKKILASIFILLICAVSSVNAEPAKTYIDEVQQNQMRFDKNYKGKALVIEGIVNTIEGKNGGYSLQVFGEKGDINPFSSIECIFGKSHEDALLDLNKGDKVSIKGTYNGKQQIQLGALVLFDCEILEKASVPSEADERDASNIISELRNMKAASMMFYADNMDKGNAALTQLINTRGSAKTLLAPYMNNSEKFNSDYLFTAAEVDGKTKWFVGFYVEQKSEGVKKILQERSSAAALLNETMKPYSGGKYVLMIVR